MVAAQALNGELRVIRRDDLKQVAALKVREARCFDFCGDVVILGTEAPARLLAFDLSAASPKVGHSLKLDVGSSVVSSINFVGPGTCICGLVSDGDAFPSKVLVVDCGDGLSIAQHVTAVAVTLYGTGCVTASADRHLSVWQLAGQGLELVSELVSELPGAGDRGHHAPALAADLAGRFAVVAEGDAGPLVHDLRAAGEPALLPMPPTTCLTSSATGESVGAPAAWLVQQLHVEGTLLLAEVSFAGWGPAPAGGGGPRLFAWHLPSCRPLLWGLEAAPVTAFARVDADASGCLVFAGKRLSDRGDGRMSYWVVVPSAGTVRRPSRRGSLPGAVRRAAQGSDVRARAMHKQGRLRR